MPYQRAMISLISSNLNFLSPSFRIQAFRKGSSGNFGHKTRRDRTFLGIFESQGNYVFSEQWVSCKPLEDKVSLGNENISWPKLFTVPTSNSSTTLFFSNLQLLKSCTKAMKGHHKEGWGIPHLNFHFSDNQLCSYLSLKKNSDNSLNGSFCLWIQSSLLFVGINVSLSKNWCKLCGVVSSSGKVSRN